jgi:hypothetical protein
MKFIVASVFVAIGSYVAISESELFLKEFTPSAAETTARYSLRAVADAARVDAVLAGSNNTSDFLEPIVDRVANKDALTVEADGSVSWSDGVHCFRLFGGPVEESDRIVPCD